MIRVVVSTDHSEADLWIETLGMPDVALIATTPEELAGVRADELHVVGRAPSQLPFQMHHAMTKVKRPRPRGREYPEVFFH